MTTIGDIADALNNLPEDDRNRILNLYCQQCHVYIGDDADWSGRNFCASCSPDPEE